MNFKEIKDTYSNKPSMFQIRLFAEKRFKPKKIIKKRKFYKRKIGPIRLFLLFFIIPFMTKMVTLAYGGDRNVNAAGVVAGAGALAASQGITYAGKLFAAGEALGGVGNLVGGGIGALFGRSSGTLLGFTPLGWVAIGILALLAISGGACDDCGSCDSCGETTDSESDGPESNEDRTNNEDKQPTTLNSICQNMAAINEITISGSKSETASYNTYTYSYSIKACRADVTYDIYLKGANRLTCESGFTAFERSKSRSNSIVSAYDFGVICIYTIEEGELCSALT